MASERVKARQAAEEILGRGEGERSTAQLRADIACMAETVLWLYTDFAWPMVYGKGNLIELSAESGGARVCGLEKSGEGWRVKLADGECGLGELEDAELLGGILNELLRKEELDWEYYCDNVPESER